MVPNNVNKAEPRMTSKKKLFKKGILFLLLIAVLFISLKNLLPYYWGNQDLVKKISYLRKNIENYNTVIIGSSIIYRHLIPEEFDAITGNTSTFNLGSSGMRFVESSFILENLLNDSEINGIQHIILLTNSVLSEISERRFLTLRSKYYLDNNRLKLYLNYFRDNYEQKKRRIQTYVYNLFYLGQTAEIMDYFFNRRFQTLTTTEIDGHGFWALDDDPEQAPVSAFFLKSNPGENLEGFDKVFDEDKYPLTLSVKEKYFLEELKRLEALCLEKNIVLHYVFTPNNFFYRKVDLSNELYLGDGVDYSEFFQTKYHFDTYHLNKAGAIIFSKRLGKLFVENANQ